MTPMRRCFRCKCGLKGANAIQGGVRVVIWSCQTTDCSNYGVISDVIEVQNDEGPATVPTLRAGSSS